MTSTLLFLIIVTAICLLIPAKHDPAIRLKEFNEKRKRR